MSLVLLLVFFYFFVNKRYYLNITVYPKHNTLSVSMTLQSILMNSRVLSSLKYLQPVSFTDDLLMYTDS